MVSYNTSVILSAPTMRAFIPNGDSVILPRTLDDPTNGTAAYTMILSRGTQALLMFDGGPQHQETTNLIIGMKFPLRQSILREVFCSGRGFRQF